MSSTFYLFPKVSFDVTAISEKLLSYPGARINPDEYGGILFAEDEDAVESALQCLARMPPENPYVIIVSVSPERVEVFREATRPVLDAFRDPLKSVLLPETLRVEDDEGRVIERASTDQLVRSLLS